MIQTQVFPTEPIQRLMNKQEAAQALGVCVRTLDYMRKAGSIKDIKIGSTVKFHPAEIQRVQLMDTVATGAPAKCEAN